MPQLHKRLTAFITGFCALKNLFRVHVQKSEADRPLAHNTFQMSTPSTAAELLFRIECHDGVSTLPDPIRPGEAPVSDTFAERPYSNQAIKVPASRGYTRCDHIGVIKG